MTTTPNYFKIGLFVIVATIILLVAVTIFGVGMLTQEKSYFETYFDTSVHGLSVGSPVEARGVLIGHVDRIAFVRDEYDVGQADGTFSKYERYIMVVCTVDPDFVPEFSVKSAENKLKLFVKDGLRIRLANEILTGLGYLEADFLESSRYPVRDIEWEPKYTYIPSAPSELSTLKDSVDKILFKLEQIDVETIGQSVQSLLRSLNRDTTKLLAQAQGKLKDLDTEGITQEINNTLNAFNTALVDANVPELSGQASKTLMRLDHLVSGQAPLLEQVVLDLREIAENLKTLSSSLSRNPSDILFSKPPPKTEPTK